jgi:hypothetical protein
MCPNADNESRTVVRSDVTRFLRRAVGRSDGGVRRGEGRGQMRRVERAQVSPGGLYQQRAFVCFFCKPIVTM